MAIKDSIAGATVSASSKFTGSIPAGTVRSYFSFRFMIVGCFTVLGYVMLVRWYQGWAAWEYGTDATDPNFDKYWMTLLYVQLAVFVSAVVTAVIGLWITRDRNLKQITPDEELRRYMRFLGIAFVYAFSFVWAGSFFAEQDAAWHQVVVRDTSFTPSHIILFYGAFPIYITLGFITFLYATTRLPLYAKGISIPLVIIVIGPFMILPNVGFNEWGHAFWFMEEYFTAPLHWGFVAFGWSALGMGGVFIQVLSRMTVLLDQVFGEDTTR